ncbi:MAG: hypothetical protein KGI46_03845 [Alphaproteobacteria bacterium]|nr:hypothetical protein [Alphaproteobacteria bacterium]MDE1930105.1 hypothetical protein [Alphaproteobacteria bacterium]
MSERRFLVLRWARNGAIIGVALDILGLLLPAGRGAYLPWDSVSTATYNLSAMLTTILVGALIGASLAQVLHYQRLREHRAIRHR